MEDAPLFVSEGGKKEKRGMGSHFKIPAGLRVYFPEARFASSHCSSAEFEGVSLGKDGYTRLWTEQLTRAINQEFIERSSLVEKKRVVWFRCQTREETL